MNILALDSLFGVCTVALFKDGTIFSRTIENSYEQGKVLFLLLREILAESGIELSKIDGLAFSNGPGNFTGIRLVMGIMQGFFLVNPVAVWGKSSLLIMAVHAYKHTGSREVLVIQDAKMGEWFVGKYRYNDSGWQGEDKLLKEEQVKGQVCSFPKNGVITGDGANLFGRDKVFLQTHLDGDTLLTFATEQILKDAVYEFPEPCYLRTEVAWTKAK